MGIASLMETGACPADRLLAAISINCTAHAAPRSCRTEFIPFLLSVPDMRLIGLDFGSTTTSAMVARFSPRGGAERRSELTDLIIEFRSEPIFTPYVSESLDDAALAAWLDAWAATTGIDAEPFAGGGAIVTGLAAQARNAGVVRRLVRERFGETLIATADDPALESWLAFMGNCRDLSLAEPDRWFLNLDIGGGTTNVALGKAGRVERVGCYHFGAHHLQVEPGTWNITRLSAVGRRLLDALRIDRRPGDSLTPHETDRLLDFFVRALEAIVTGQARHALGTQANFLEQLPYDAPRDVSPVVTFSGGVGELLYRSVLEGIQPTTTAFGDAGGELAVRIARSNLLSAHLRTHTPVALGRATVLGLTVHHLQLSGSTLYLPRTEVLPLTELPIVGRVDDDPTDEQLDMALGLARHSARGACIAVRLSNASAAAVRSLGTRLAERLVRSAFPTDHPLVLLLDQNAGKTLGSYATRWGRLPVTLVVLDELPDRGAAFVTLGKPVEQLVPVSFYGIHSRTGI